MRSEHISVVINRPAADVYAFAADPVNLPRWASGLAQSRVEQDGDSWVVDSPMGRVSFRFAAPNDFGVLDHDVTLPSGDVVTNHMRVISHPEGAEVIFSLRQLGSEAEFEQDAAMVRADLAALRELLGG